MSHALARLRERLRRLGFFVSQPSSRSAVLAACVIAVGVLVIGHEAKAIDFPSAQDATDWVLNAIGQLLAIIIDVLGKLVIIVVNVLIAFAQYNNFLKAQPVEIGWVLVRDVVNMFFIVVLLISAFSTIIGYKEFHYSRVLPRLLLMAVLINFSKTLIGLMIDFSQVLMLTFVNAFKQAAGGNFVTALKLDKVTKLGESQEGYEPLKLVAASVLGIIMLGIALTLVVIMTAFIAFRIVGLWFLLIMSPMAFFAWALPGKLQKALTAFTDTFWSRLSTLLIAGPVMAFFLWLALAVVQGSGLAFGDTIGDSAELNSAAGSDSFVSAVGTPAEIGTFIVAVILMLQGVEFAVKASSSLGSSILKGFAERVQGGGGVAVHLARGAARVTGRVAGAAGRAGFEGIDRLADVRGKIGRAGLRLAPAGVGAETFAGLAGYRGRQIGERRARISKATAGLSAEDRLSFNQAKAASLDRYTATAAQINLGKDSTTELGLKALSKKEEAKLGHITDEGERAVLAKGLAQRRAAEYLKGGKDAAIASGDDDSIKSFDEALDKNPALSPDWARLGGIASGRTEDVKKYLQTKKASAFEDSGSALAMMYAVGAVRDDGSVDTTSDGYKRLMEGGGNRAAFVQKHLTESTQEQRAAQFKAMKAGATDDDRKAADQARSYVSKDKDGRILSMQLSQAVAPQVKIEQKFTRNEQAIQAAQQRAEAAPVGSAQASTARSDAMAAGARLPEAFKYNAGQGVFESAGHRKEFDGAMNQLSEDLKKATPKAMDILARMDVDSLAANAGGYNEARSAAMANIQLESLKAAYEQAAEKGNKDIQAKVSQLIDTFEKEGKRIDVAAKKAGVSAEQLAGVASNPKSATSVTVIQKLQAANIANPEEAAQAATKGWEIRDKYGALRSGVSSRAATGARRAVQATGAAAKEKAVSYKERRKQSRDEAFERRRQKFEDKALGEDET
ncbi:hypothetical protein HY479_04160 [Candidatus Uhrbacteria bacterium]|nr:hypothetical protein [Candidatus Uhrbacteria bacterium]